MILYIASVIIWIFICASLFCHASCNTGIKLVGAAILLVISLKYEVYQLLGGAFFAPQLPRTLLLTYESLYGAFLCLFFLLLLWDLYLFGNYLLSRCGIPVPTSLPKGWIKFGLCLLALGLGVWGTMQATEVPDVKNIEVPIANLPEGLVGTKLVQLADIHIGPILKKDWLGKVVDRVNALDADLVLMTGDYVDGHVDQIEAELLPLADLKAKYGVYAVTGNHEYYWDMPAWKRALEHLQIKFLENEHKMLKINGETIVVAGIPDVAAAKFGFAEPNPAKALANAPEVVRILLSHQPRHGLPKFEKVDLMLSGHTHGGLMFFLQPLISRFNGGFVNGMYAGDNGNIYVSPGTGLWNGLSCRIGVPPEITLLTLTKKS